MNYYAKLPYYDTAPVPFVPTPEQLETAAAQAYIFVGDGKASREDIERYLLVTLGYAGQFGATGDHVDQILAILTAGVTPYLKMSTGLFLEPEEPEE